MSPKGKRFRYSLTAVGLAAALVTMAACGSSKSTSSKNTSASSSSTGGSQGTTASTASAASGSPFVIGAISDATGAQSSSLATTLQTAQAWASWINDNGGINGHPVKLIAKDSASNPSTALTEVKEMVEQDHIIALVGDQTNFDAQFATYLRQQGIPIVGGSLAQKAAISDPNYFPQGATKIPNGYNEIHLAVAKGLTKMGYIYCAESPSCAQGVPTRRALAAMQGAQLVYSGAVAAAAPDYTAQCLAAKGAGAQVRSIAHASAVVIRVATSCSQQGYNPLKTGNDGEVAVNWATSPAMQGAVASQNDAPFSDTSNPAIQTMINALDKYQPSVTKAPSWGMNDVYAWASGQLFAAAAKAANLGDGATSAQVVTGLYKLHDETLGGIAPPLNFTNNGKGHNIYCSFVQGVENNAFVQPQGDTLTCAPQATMAPLITAMGG